MLILKLFFVLSISKKTFMIYKFFKLTKPKLHTFKVNLYTSEKN